jgi:hypothetical protein
LQNARANSYLDCLGFCICTFPSAPVHAPRDLHHRSPIDAAPLIGGAPRDAAEAV